MTLPASSPAVSNPVAPCDPGGTIFTPHRRTQTLVGIASICSFILFWWGGRWVGIPREVGYQGSLVQQSAWPVLILVTYLLLAIGITVATLIAGRSWFFGGLFAAMVGLTALSIRGGPMHYVLFNAYARGSGAAVFMSLLAEQLMLFAPLAVLWRRFAISYQQSSALPSAPGTLPAPRTASDSGWTGIVVQIAIMAAMVMLFTPTDSKKQVLLGVFIAALASTGLAEQFAPDRKSPAWYWTGPFVVGAAGYILAYLNATPSTTGDPAGLFAALARPLPLDYAGAGCAGALLGYWMGGDRPQSNVSILQVIAKRPAPSPSGSKPFSSPRSE